MSDKSSIFSGIGQLTKLGETLLDIRDLNKLGAIQLEFNRTLLSLIKDARQAEEEKTALNKRITELEQLIVEHDEFATEKANYVRTEIAGGCFAYIRKDNEENFHNAHKYCCNCFDHNKQATLQFSTVKIERGGRVNLLRCPNNCPDIEFTAFKDSY